MPQVKGCEDFCSPNVWVNEGWPSAVAIDAAVVGDPYFNGYQRDDPGGSGMRGQPSVLPQQPGECNESFYSRAASDTLSESPLAVGDGLNDPNKIVNATIPNNCMNQVEAIMRLGASVTPPTLLTWSISAQPPSVLPPGLVIDPMTGRITGTVPHDVNLIVEAKDGLLVLDSKPFTIKRRNCQTGIRLQFPMPAGSQITSPYGMRKLTTKWKFHPGIDIVGPAGSPILAAFDGMVLYAGPASGFGMVIVIGHFDETGKQVCCTVYGHIDPTAVVSGQRVTTGQTIATQGNLGTSTGPHLHFEVRKPEYGRGTGSHSLIAWGSATHVDPEQFLNGALVVDRGTELDAVAAPLSFPNGIDPSHTTGNTETIIAENRLINTDGFEPSCNNYADGPINIDPLADPSAGATGPALGPASLHGNCNPAFDGMTKQQIITIMNGVMNNADPPLTQEDRNYLFLVARSETGGSFDPCADNPTSTATGLFQMTDATGAGYGVPTCADRCDPFKATEAGIKMFRDEERYYNGWIASGKTKIIGKTIAQNATTARYADLPKPVWMYGLIHGMGVGNAIKGNDRTHLIDYAVKHYNSSTHIPPT